MGCGASKPHQATPAQPGDMNKSRSAAMARETMEGAPQEASNAATGTAAETGAGAADGAAPAVDDAVPTMDDAVQNPSMSMSSLASAGGVLEPKASSAMEQRLEDTDPAAAMTKMESSQTKNAEAAGVGERAPSVAATPETKNTMTQNEGQRSPGSPAAAVPMKSASSSNTVAPSLSPTTKHMLTSETPMDVSILVDKAPDGCYLVYDEPDSGTFFAKYSKTIIPEALAFCSVGDLVVVPAFKYKTPVRIQSRVRTGRTNYFQAWCQWIKEARAIEGYMVLLPAFEAMMDSDPVGFPPMNIFFLSGTTVKRLDKGVKSTPYNLKAADAVACVPESYTGLDDALKPGGEIQKSEFLAKVKVPQDKFYIEFQR